MMKDKSLTLIGAGALIASSWAACGVHELSNPVSRLSDSVYPYIVGRFDLNPENKTYSSDDDYNEGYNTKSKSSKKDKNLKHEIKEKSSSKKDKTLELRIEINDDEDWCILLKKAMSKHDFSYLPSLGMDTEKVVKTYVESEGGELVVKDAHDLYSKISGSNGKYGCDDKNMESGFVKEMIELSPYFDSKKYPVSKNNYVKLEVWKNWQNNSIHMSISGLYTQDLKHSFEL